MGVSTEPLSRSRSTPARDGVRWLPAWLQTGPALRRLALTSVVANVVIVVTGGAVRLTDSGLGCPTWPRCTDASLTPTRQYAIHGIIEFANRQLTVVLVVVALATWLVAMARREQRGLATWAALGIPAQAVLGGLTVLTHLNPWLVAAHFMLSMAVIAVTFLLWWRLRDARGVPPLPAPLVRVLTRVTAGAALATLVVGTVVTGSGPHAGDKDTSGKGAGYTVHRTGLKVASMSQLHADVVMVLIGLTVGLVVLAYAVHAGAAVRRATVVLLAVELAQGVIGFTQYFLHVPPLLVGLHMLGACLVWLAALQVLLQTEPFARRGVALRTAG
ncbi:heme A synthase [uncultured Jatrophihabitans sp.]|uniref:COX15/CtaA family protein n=1 Tax=uncultured Jatrophihabitans sp. TaxID=1610747 RepID=UPI0035CBA45A